MVLYLCVLIVFSLHRELLKLILATDPFLRWFCHIYSLGERVNYDEYESESSWCPTQNTHDVDSPYCKGPGDIDRPKRICMLCCLLLEELAVIALGDDLHHVILSC
jgi:hypothetical protein